MNAQNEMPTDIAAKELPSDWQLSTLGDLLKVRNGFAFKSKDYQEVGALLIRQSNLGGSRVNVKKAKYLPESYLEEYRDYLVKKGDILIGMSGSIGKLCTYDRNEPALQNQRTGLLLFKDAEQKPWVWHYLPLLEKELLKVGKGVAVQNISAIQIESFPIPVAPLAQQKRIVAEIEKQFSRLDEAVANFKRIKANLKRYKAAVLKSAVEGKLTEAWRKAHPDVESASTLLERILTDRRAKWKGKGKYKDTPVPDTQNLPTLPNAWTWSSVETLCSDIVDCPHSTPKWEATGRACLRTTEFRPGRLVLTDVRFVSQSTYEKRIQRLKPRENDIVYSREGGILGIACMIPSGVEPCLGQRMMLLRSHALFTPNLLMYWLNSSWTLARVRSLTGGSASPHLNVGEVKLFPVPLAPLAEQEQIVSEVERRLSVIEALEATVEANLTRASRLRQSILSTAFSGRLTVSESKITKQTNNSIAH